MTVEPPESEYTHQPSSPARLNPYAAPASSEITTPIAEPVVRRVAAVGACVVSTIGTLLYTWIDEVVLATRYGAWNMLIASAVFAAAVAWWTRDRLVAPACCFLAVVTADLLAALVRDWAYAQFHLCVPLAAAFSLPALFIAWWRWSSLSTPRAPRSAPGGG